MISRYIFPPPIADSYRKLKDGYMGNMLLMFCLTAYSIDS